MSGNPRNFVSKEMLDELVETFEMLDEEKNGVITRQQIHVAFKVFGVAENRDVLNKATADLGEFVDFDEYLHVFVTLMQHSQWAYQEMQEAFHVFDKDRNGYLDPIEMKRVFTKIGEVITDNEVEDQLRAHDIDGDCHLVMAEFMKMILQFQKGAR